MHWGYIATGAVAASLLWWKRKKTEQAAEITIISIDIVKNKEPLVVYKGINGKSNAAYLGTDNIWYLMKNDTIVDPAIAVKLSTALTKATSKVIKNIKYKPNQDILMIGPQDDTEDWWKPSKF